MGVVWRRTQAYDCASRMDGSERTLASGVSGVRTLVRMPNLVLACQNSCITVSVCLLAAKPMTHSTRSRSAGLSTSMGTSRLAHLLCGCIFMSVRLDQRTRTRATASPAPAHALYSASARHRRGSVVSTIHVTSIVWFMSTSVACLIGLFRYTLSLLCESLW